VKGFSAAAVSLSKSLSHEGIGKKNNKTRKIDLMRTTEILRNETPNRCLTDLVAVKSVRRFLATSVVALLAFGATLNAQTVYSVNIVGCVPDMTINLLTARLTTAQRQALHAQNFNQLPPSARAVYLHTVAYAVGFMVGSGAQVPDSTVLVNHLENVQITSIYEAPAIPPEYSQEVSTYMTVIKTALHELNVLIADPVANNSSYQDAMRAGALDSVIGWLIGG
jgi:hypothetical protein